MKKKFILANSLAFVFVLNITTPTQVFGQKSTSLSTAVERIENWPKFFSISDYGSFYAPMSSIDISKDYLLTNLNLWMGTDSDHTFQFVKSETDDIGFTHSTYQHYYKGIKVQDDLLLIHEKDGKVMSVNGEFNKNFNINIVAPISKLDMETTVRDDFGTNDVTFADYEQVIAKVPTEKGVKVLLTTKINALSLSTLRGFIFYVDNSNGKIVNKISKIYKCNNTAPHIHGAQNYYENHFISPLLTSSALLADTPSTSATYYRGNQPITVDSYNGQYRLKDSARNIYTRNGAGWDGSGNPINGELTGSITEYLNSTPNYTSTATRPAVEVHWAMKTAYDYYINRHSRNSYDGDGSLIRNYYDINFNFNQQTGQPQTPIESANAAAIDQQGIVGMLYGSGLYQGQQGYFYPFVALDVAGHEYSHLMVSRTGNLAYQGESGALNESFADIFGAAIEFYANLSPNWNIGEGLLNPQIGAYLRSMSNPNSGPVALGSQQPDTYNGTYWVSTAQGAADNGGVHTNSGVGNYWFYLLTAGGSGTNDINNTFNVSGITIQKSEKIAYRLLANYLTPNSQYVDAYTLSQQAVTDLYGASGNEQLQNVRAWYAVGFGTGQLSTKEIAPGITENVDVYPNPVKDGTLYISTKNSQSSYQIYDVAGRLIRSTEALKSGVNKINIEGLSKGTYLLHITSPTATTTEKIIVQ